MTEPANKWDEVDTPNKTFRWVVVVVLIGSVIWWCSGRGHIHFIEEIQLSNGEAVQAERSIEASSLGEIGGPGGWESKYQSFEIVPAEQPNPLPKWESTTGLIPILFDRDSGNDEWVLLATFYTCEAWYTLGRPKHPYTEFRIRNGQWQKVELSDQWFGRAANVFSDIRSGGEPEHLRLADKKARADDRVAPEYRTIVNNWSTAC